jgi:hypothetical protein
MATYLLISGHSRNYGYCFTKVLRQSNVQIEVLQADRMQNLSKGYPLPVSTAVTQLKHFKRVSMTLLQIVTGTVVG